MSFRLRTIEYTADGRQIVRDRMVEKTTLSVGRSTENDIHLPDLAVDPAHAVIEALADGRVAVRAVGTLGFARDGATTQEAEFSAARGAELRFGTYALTVSRDDDGALLVSVAQVEALDQRAADDAKRGFALAAAMPGKRRLSWVLAGLVLLAFLAFPIASNLWHQADPKRPVAGDSSWSAGKLSLAHHALEGKCEACHVKPFESVRDKACTTCHEKVHDHADPLRLATAHEGGPLGTRLLWAVGKAFGKPGPGACVDCHVEHQGPQRMALPAQQFCADCHGVLSDRLGDTKLGDASDFGSRHPQFSPAIVVDPASRRRVATTLDGAPREHSGLAFPHKLHLDPRGGVARMAASIGAERGYGPAGMDCKDCHRPTEDGVRFQPIRMDRDCESCHSLAYDRVGGTVRRLKHGDVDQMVADLAVADFRRPLSPRQRPGDYAQGRPYFSNFGSTSINALLIQRALTPQGVCGECHTPVTTNGRPGVMPVTLVSRYMPQGWFDHKAHAQEKCTSCHKAGASSSSSDVLLPGIAQCRTCHLGEDAHSAPVPSGCTMCHTYHPGQAVTRRDLMRKQT